MGAYITLAWVVLLYALGLARVWRRAGVFGLASLAAAVASPLEALTGSSSPRT